MKKYLVHFTATSSLLLASCAGLHGNSDNAGKMVFDRISEECDGNLRLLDQNVIVEYKDFKITDSKSFIEASETAKLNNPGFKGKDKYEISIGQIDPQKPVLVRFIGNGQTSKWAEIPLGPKQSAFSLVVEAEQWDTGNKISSISLNSQNRNVQFQQIDLPIGSFDSNKALELVNRFADDPLPGSPLEKSEAILKSWNSMMKSDSPMPQSCELFSDPLKAYATVWATEGNPSILVQYVADRIRPFNQSEYFGVGCSSAVWNVILFGSERRCHLARWRSWLH